MAQHAASSQFLNDWSAIRITDPAAKKRLAEIGGQPYIATAPLLYVFVLDEHRNAAIAARKGVEVASDAFTLNGSYRFTQAQNDAVLALHAMETAAYSLGLGCVILGSLLNDVPALIDLLNLPEYTYPVLGIAIGKPDQEPALPADFGKTLLGGWLGDADGGPVVQELAARRMLRYGLQRFDDVVRQRLRLEFTDGTTLQQSVDSCVMKNVAHTAIVVRAARFCKGIGLNPSPCENIST